VNRIVYSTDGKHEQLCPRCGKDPCVCADRPTAPANQHSPRVRREIKGRGGKTVTVIHDLALSDRDLQDLGKKLKQLCATGGTVKEGRIEIRGDHRDRIVAELQKLGYRAKAAGG